MSSSANYHRQQQQQQQQQATRRLRNATAHDAAAVLYDEMSRAVVTAHTSRNPSPEVHSRGHHGEGACSSSPPHSALSSLIPAKIVRPVITPHAGSGAVPLSSDGNVATTAANPLFYVRPLSSSFVKGMEGGIGGGGLYGNNSNRVMTRALTDTESNSTANIGRSTLASASLTVSPSQQSVTAGIVPPVSLLNSGNAMNNNNNNDAVGTSSSSVRGGSMPSAVPSTAATASSTSPVYARHTSASMSTAAPWLQLHRSSVPTSATTITSSGVPANPLPSSNAISSSNSAAMRPGSPGQPAAVIRKISSTPECPSTSTPVAANTAAATAGAGASGVGTPKKGNVMCTAMAGAPPATLDLNHIHSFEDEAAMTCQLSQCLHCVCWRGGGTGEGGFNGLSAYSSWGTNGGGGSSSGDASRSAVPTLQQQQRPLYLPPSPAAAVETIVPLNLVPPFRIARVDSGVYRGAYPVLRNFPYLRRLRLRTIVSLIPEPPTFDLKCFAESEHIQLHHIHAERAKGEVQLLPSELSEALELIMNADLHPLYVHCLDGRHVTGLVIMGVRKLQMWDINAAHAEYLRFTGEEQDEVAFVADYTGPLLVPPHIPPWLWGGSLYDPATGQPKKLQPSTMRLRLSTTVTGGVASPTGANPNTAFPSGVASPLTGTGITTASNKVDGFVTGLNGGGDVRPHAAEPWMSVPEAEITASDGQLYVDVDRVQGAAALYRDTTSANYNNLPLFFSFEYAAARSDSIFTTAATGGSGGGNATSQGGSHRAPARQHSTSTTAAPSLKVLNTASIANTATPTHNSSSHQSSQSNSTNGSMASSPAAAVALGSTAAGGGATAPWGWLANATWAAATAPQDAAPQTRSAPYHTPTSSPNTRAAPAGPTPPQQQRASSTTLSNGSNTANETFSGSFFDGQLSALMWTSGLSTSPSARKAAATSAAGTAAASDVNGSSEGGGGVSAGAVTGGNGGSGGVTASAGSRRTVGVGGNASGNNASSPVMKRSFSR